MKKPQLSRKFTLVNQFAFLVLCLLSATAQGQLEASGNNDQQNTQNTPEYFTLAEKIENSAKTFASLETLVSLQNTDSAKEPSVARINLLSWVRHNLALANPPEQYNRKEHFGSWVVANRSRSCLNTRAQVLVRDSSGQVTYRQNNPCVVEAGTWDDPYTGRNFYSSRDIQIDHVVPLKNAFQSGAWRWKRAKRCQYANFVANSYHLMAVSGRENMVKRDGAPDRYLPPNQEYVCDYIQRWLKIKLIWRLALVPSEANGVARAIREHRCDSSLMRMTEAELRKQRGEVDQLSLACARYTE